MNGIKGFFTKVWTYVKGLWESNKQYVVKGICSVLDSKKDDLTKLITDQKDRINAEELSAKIITDVKTEVAKYSDKFKVITDLINKQLDSYQPKLKEEIEKLDLSIKPEELSIQIINIVKTWITRQI